MSDAPELLRAAARDGWNGRNITVPPTADIVYFRSYNKPSGALTSTLGEIFALAYCTYKVISARSGLGRIAAFISNPINSTVQITAKYSHSVRQFAVGAIVPPKCVNHGSETSGSAERAVAAIAHDTRTLGTTHSKI